MFVNCSRCGEHGLAWIRRKDRRKKFIEKEVVCICIINELYLYAGDEYGENGQVNDASRVKMAASLNVILDALETSEDVGITE
jgi:hypothetical protein